MAKKKSATVVKSKSDAKTESAVELKDAPAKKKLTAKKSEKAVKAAAPKKAVKTEEIRSWYDYPELYELGFLEDTPKEACFLMDVFNKHVSFPVERVLEVGCGSGRLICDMAGRGFAMTGLDLNATALDYCEDKLDSLGRRAELTVGDMTNFSFSQQFDAVVNAINTFRHLESEEAALAHLNCVADHLKTGGVFVLSLHLLPRGGDLWGTERWSAKTPDMKVNYALTVVDTSLETRLEKLRISMTVKKNDGESFRLADHITLRIYTVGQLKSLLAKCPKLEIAAVHDFWYEIDSTQKLNTNACDTILVLKKV